jgi:hypothetical protein
LWTKIRRELQEYFTEHEADGARVIVWAHKQVCNFFLTQTKTITIILDDALGTL